MSANLIIHAGGVRRTRADLATLHTPEPTTTWKPVPHSVLVSELIRGLDRQGVDVVRDEYATMGRDDARLFGVMDLRIANLDTPDFSMALGLRGANDRTMSIQVVAAARVFVCDNLAFSGGGAGAVVLRKKHTSRLDLAALVPGAVGSFLVKAEAFRVDIDKMKDFALSEGQAKELILDAFTGPAPVLPLRCLPAVSHLYFDDEEQRAKFDSRSLFSLNNAFTEAVKVLKEVPRYEGGLRIGRYFGRVVHRRRPEVVAVIDGIEILN